MGEPTEDVWNGAEPFVAAAEQRGYQKAIDDMRDGVQFWRWASGQPRPKPGEVNLFAADYLESLVSTPGEERA